jgi:hypothetical protein
MLIIINVLCWITLLTTTFYFGSVSARQNLFVSDYTLKENQALTLDDPTLSRVVQGELGSGVSLFSFTVTKGTDLEINLNVPRLPGLDNFRPALALFGPGLPKPPASELQGLPFNLPPEFGLVLSQDDPSDKQERPHVDEGYTQSGYWEGQRIGRDLPQDGTYYLAVFNPTKQEGKYALFIGDRNEVGVVQIISFPVLWLRLRFWFGQAWVVVLLVVVIAGLIGGIYFWRKRRLSRKKLTITSDSVS